MNRFARAVITLVLGAALVVFGLYKIAILHASRGGLMPERWRQGLIAFSDGIPGWQRYLVFALFALLPVLYAVLWWRGRRGDRQIRIAEGMFIQESAISGFLRSAVSDLKEVKSITARCKMIRDKGLLIDCHVKLETSGQIDSIRARLRRAVLACMDERLGILPVADVRIFVKGLSADRATAQLAATAAVASTRPTATPAAQPAAPPPTTVQPVQEPAERATIDLSPPEEGEEEDRPSPLDSAFMRSVLEEPQEGERPGETPPRE